MRVAVRLEQDGRAVAAGVAEWELREDVTRKLHFERAPTPAGAKWPGRWYLEKYLEYGVLHCYDGPSCSQVWRFDINEEARNYLDESLWATLYGAVP